MLTGKKSLDFPVTVNSIVPDLLVVSITGNLHSKIFFLLSYLYSPSQLFTTGGPLPALYCNYSVRICESDGIFLGTNGVGMEIMTSLSSMSVLSSSYSILTSHLDPTSLGQQLTSSHKTIRMN